MAVETNLTLGEFLRQERERRGLTIEQVASATKIGVKTLHALEGDRYAELPAKPFVRGFVNSYARFIGVDSKEILTRFGDFLEAKAQDRPKRDSGHSGYAFEKRDGDPSRAVLWVVMGTFVVAGGLATVIVKKPLGHHHGTQADKLRTAYGVSPSPSPNPSPEPGASPSFGALALPIPSSSLEPLPSVSVAPTSGARVALEAVPVPTPMPVGNPVATDEGPSAEDPLNSGLKLKPSEIKYKVIFKASESAWVRYQCDHRPITQFVFRTGKTLVLRARESIRFQVSPPKALSFTFHGSGFKPVLGDRHLVSRQNDATLFFPFEVADTIKEPFPGERALSSRAVPLARPSPFPMTPSQ